MIRPMLRASQAAILVAATACSLATGCAFFENLNSSGYSQEAGVDAQCNLDEGCRYYRLTCGPDCPSAQICCIPVNASGVQSPACTSLSECSSQSTSQSTSFALCNGPSDCEDAGSCIPQRCPFGNVSVEVWACTLLPICMPI